MKIRVYLREWFYNAGIVGFLRILKEENVEVKSNYIELETENLKDFHIKYFQHFFDKYNIAKKMEERMKKSFITIKTNLENSSDDKEIMKKQQERVKQEKKYIKASIKTQMDKIKKFDEETYEKMLENYASIDSVKQKEEIEELENIFNTIIQCLYQDNINKKLTLNLFKSILSNKYFGQPSFLNVVKSGETYEKQEEIFYQDYISNIVETGFLKDFIDGRKSLNELKSHIENKEHMAKEMEKIYNNIDKKYLQKQKTKEEIEQYIKEIFITCNMCENESIIINNYSESNFIPLAVSSDNMRNFFWNQNAKFPVCDLCKLILFCIPAGITATSKIVRENESGKAVYKEKEVYSFVNYDTTVNQLLKTNNHFSDCSKKDKTVANPYEIWLLDMVEQEAILSSWQLENIFVVEFEAEYLAYSRMEYFSIHRYIAIFFKDYAKSNLSMIKDYKYKIQIMDYILKNKDILPMITDRLKEQLVNKTLYGWESYLALNVRMNLNVLKKKEVNQVKEEIEKNNKKIHVLYNIGVQIHEQLKQENSDNKLDGYIYKMLNCIRTGKKNDFINIAIKLLMSMQKDVPEILVQDDEILSWQEKGNSFIAGLLSNKFERTDNKEEVKNNE